MGLLLAVIQVICVQEICLYNLGCSKVASVEVPLPYSGCMVLEKQK